MRASKGLVPRVVSIGVGVVGGASALVLLPAPAASPVALSILVAGAFIAVVMGAGGAPASLSSRAGSGAAQAASDIALAFSLREAPVTLPAAGNLSEEWVFLPASPLSRPLPTLDQQTRLYAFHPDTQPGILIAPPGRAWIDEALGTMGMPLAADSLADAEQILRSLGAYGLAWSELRIEQAESLNVRRRVGPASSCAAQPDLCGRGFCPHCSAIAVALVRVVRRPLVLVDTVRTGAVLDLRFREVADP